MIVHFLKFWLYADKELFIEAVRHPIRTLSRIGFFSSNSNYLEFVSKLTESSNTFVQSLKPSKESEKLLLGAFRKSLTTRSGERSCDPEVALSLYFIIRILKPTHVVETGVSAGRSSAYILCALKDNKRGELYSIDPDADVGYAIPQELLGRWRFINETSENKLPNLLDQLSEIDVFLHDSLHTYENMIFEFNTAWPHLRKGGLLLADNVNLNNAYEDFTRKLEETPVYLHEKFAGIRRRTSSLS